MAASSSSVTSVVSNLVRGQVSTSVSSMVTEEDLDRHIAELILKEAKKKAQLYSETGLRGLLRNAAQLDSNAPRTNKRFLSSIIRSTDDHNKTILRAQAQAAEEIKKARAEEERRERRARAEEAVQARRSAKKKVCLPSEDEEWDRWDGRTADRKRKARDWETWEGEEEDDKARRHERERRRKRNKKEREERDKQDKRSLINSPLPSKMDKYFEESYDPRLDVAPLSVPQIPATGLISNAEFEGWDAMLELIRVRKEDKQEKKRLERLGLKDAAVLSRWNGESVSLMDIEYQKRGTVREWDIGKQGF